MKKVFAIMGMIFGFALTTFGQKPAVVTDNDPGWKRIGQVTASFKTTNESIVVLGADEFQAIRLKVKDAPLHIDHLQVFYESGDMEEINVRSELKEGAETRIINLSNPTRDIKKVAFTYKTLPNASGQKADVELYGLKTANQGDAYRETEKKADKAETDIERASEKAEKGLDKGVKETEDGLDEAGNKISEGAAKAAAEIKDQRHETKVGPGGQTIYIDNESKYYYVNDEGKKVYVTSLQLKDKPDND